MPGPPTASPSPSRSARVATLARRPAMNDAPTVPRARDLELYRLARRVTRDGRALALPPREFALLKHVLRRNVAEFPPVDGPKRIAEDVLPL